MAALASFGIFLPETRGGVNTKIAKSSQIIQIWPGELVKNKPHFRTALFLVWAASEYAQWYDSKEKQSANYIYLLLCVLCTS